MRKITSLTAFISFFLLLLNSIVLYISPHGRIAYWADWRFLGLTKTEWGNQHIIIGVLFLSAIILHTYYNWKSIVTYLKNKAKQIKIFTREFNIALLLVVIFTIGAYVEIPPLSWVLTFSESIKEDAARHYGEPPYGRAELSSLKIFTSKMGIGSADGLKRLQSAGVQVKDEQQTLLDIANLNNTSPQQLYLLMQATKNTEAMKKFPDEIEKGFGNRRLNDICGQYGLNISTVLEALTRNRIKAEAGATIKQLAEENGVTSQDIFTVIRNVAGQPQS